MEDTSYTTILAIRGEGFVLLVADGQATSPYLRRPISMDSDKTHSPCPRVLMGCAGSLLCMKELLSTLHQYCSFQGCQTGEDVAAIIVNHINDEYSDIWEEDEIKFLIVSCIDKPRMFRIQKGQGTDDMYYMEEEQEPISAIGSGGDVIKPWFQVFQENSTPQQAFEYVEKIVPLAAKTDWDTGGNLRFTFLYQNPQIHTDGTLYHTHIVSLGQENPWDCNSPYTIRADTWI